MRARGFWEITVALVAVVAAIAAFWITIDAHFLAHPTWLAVQKADLILGPVAVGLYWRHKRPNSHLGPLLIALGLIGVPYILESSTAPALFGVGTLWESAIYVMTSVVILAFPSGRLEGVASRLIMLVILVGVVLVRLVLQLSEPHFAPAGSISGCRVACPANGLAIWSPPAWSHRLADVGAIVLIAVPIAIGAVLVYRFVNGTPPRRRALAIGAPIALLFLVMQAVYRAIFLLAPHGLSPSEQPVQSFVQWTYAGTRACIWYGFLLALIGAELFAGRTLRRLVGESLGHPSFRDLERMLRDALGDPRLRLGIWRSLACEWDGSDGRALEPPGARQVLTRLDRDAEPAVAIVHDSELSDDPELLQAAGAVALLAAENAELEDAWRHSLTELADSRSRLTRAGDAERRKLERDLHDGAQQRLLAALIRISAADELAAGNAELHATLSRLGIELEAAVDELRELARGIYPTVLADHGLAAAIRMVARRSAETVSITGISSEVRFPPEIEAAVYFCCLEAVQNASKHGGADARITIRLFADDRAVHLEVRDNGQGFNTTTVHGGVGLKSMRDRLGAVGGRVEIISAPGRGTRIVAAAPIAGHAGGGVWH